MLKVLLISKCGFCSINKVYAADTVCKHVPKR